MTRMIITILLALLIPIPGFGQDVDTQGNSPREYVIPGHGVLELTVPQSWRDEVRQPPEGLPPTIVFELESGDEFSLLISVIWSPTQEEGFNSAEKIQPLVEYGRNMMLPTDISNLEPNPRRGLQQCGENTAFGRVRPQYDAADRSGRRACA